MSQAFPRFRRRGVARIMVRRALGDVLGGIHPVETGPDRVRVAGWVESSSTPVRSIVLLLDETVIAAARVQGDVIGRRAWAAEIARDSLPFGEVTIVAAAVVDEILSVPLGRSTFVLDRVGALGALDIPGDDAVVRRAFSVSGWARPAKGVDAVELHVDGRTVARARMLAVHRPDLETILPDAEASLAGWEQIVAVPGDAHDRILLEAVAVVGDERVLLGARSLRVDRTDPPVADRDRVAALMSRLGAAAPARASTDGRRLLVATHHLGLGGGQLYLQELLRHLRDGFAITVLAAEGGVLVDELEDWGIEVHVVGHAPPTGVGYEQWMRMLVGLLGAEAPDVVLANTLGCYWGVDLAARLDRGSVWAIHESFPVEVFEIVGLPGSPDAHVLGRYRAAFHDVSLAVFEADATSELFASVIPSERRRRIDYGIDLARVAAPIAAPDIRVRLGIAEGATVLLCVGTVQPRKAQALLTAAVARLVDEHPDVLMVFVGDFPSAYSQGLRAMIAREELDEHVRLVAVTPDLDQWYSVADAFVMASDIESLPRSMLEAMAVGLPVIAPAVFGIPELITDGEHGMLFDPASVRDTEDALRRFLALDTSARRELGRAGRALVRATRDSSGYGTEVGRVLHALASRASAAPPP